MTTSTRLSELTGDYVLDAARTRIGFTARALMTKVCGQFDGFQGRAHLDGNDPSRSSVQLTIQAASIQTGLQRRDDHLRNQFLDSGNHPLITFTSARVEQTGETTFTVTGDLAIRGVTKPVTVDFGLTGTATDPGSSFRASFEGRAAINRRQWGATWNTVMKGSDALIGGKVALEFDVSAVRQS